MAARTFKNFPVQQPLDFEKQQLYDVQEFLKQAKVCVVLARDLLVEVKDLVVVLGLIAFFLWSFAQLFYRLH